MQTARGVFIFIIFQLFVLSWTCPASAQSLSGDGMEKETLNHGGIYRIPLEFSPRTLDPALSRDIYSTTVIQQIFDGLVQFDKDLNTVPAIAKSWEISPDGLTYTFHLREGVRFHNGRKLTSKDFVYSFTRILDSEVQSNFSDFFDRILGAKEFMEKRTKGVKGLVAADERTLRMILTEPYAPFISILAMKGAKVVPREEVEKKGVGFRNFPVGTGPFKFVSMKEGEQIVLEANPDYFEGRPFLDRIVYRIYHGAPRNEILRTFEEGSLEESFIPPDRLEKVVKEKQYLFLQKPLLSLRFYGFNLLSKPLDHRGLRKAIQLAIDKKFIVSELHKNQFLLAKSILPPGMPGHDPQKEMYPFDEIQARKVLAEGGDLKNQVLDIWSATQSEAAQKELNEVKSRLNRIGIRTNVRFETNWPAYESLLRNHKVPVFVYAWYADFPDPDNFLGTLFHSKSKYNYTAYQNPEVDRLLEQARAERDYLRRMEMYRKIEEMVLEDAPIVPMVNPLFQMVYQPYIRGIEVSALGGPYIPMKKVWLKKK